jgi:hypothetical protein
LAYSRIGGKLIIIGSFAGADLNPGDSAFELRPVN